MDAMRPDVEGLESKLETWAEPRGQPAREEGYGGVGMLGKHSTT
jgi:hypothetical protein